MNPLIIFTHIPKTAGTSFYREAEHYFGSERTLFDYDLKARRTSQLVRDLVYEKRDLGRFAQEVQRGDYCFLGGHISREKYARVFPDAAYVCWIREPAAQLWSHYRHHRQHRGFTDSFESFYNSPRYRDLQTRFIGTDLDRMAFIGITEEYGVCLQQFNEQFSLDFKERRANRGVKTDDEDLGPDEETRSRVRALNARDTALYESVAQRLRSPSASE